MAKRPAEIIEGVYERWGEGDFKTEEVFDRLIVFVMGPRFPDAGTYVGPAQVAGYMQHFLEPWIRVTISAEEIIEAGDTVVVSVLQEGTGSGSGAPAELRYFHVWTFRGEKAIRWESYMEREEALAVAGLPA
jgi:ketosteroid isomerase-like protein